MEQLTNKDFYFCYDRKLSKALKKKGFNFLAHANAMSSGKEFWLYHRSPEFKVVLESLKTTPLF